MSKTGQHRRLSYKNSTPYIIDDSNFSLQEKYGYKSDSNQHGIFAFVSV